MADVGAFPIYELRASARPGRPVRRVIPSRPPVGPAVNKAPAGHAAWVARVHQIESTAFPESRRGILAPHPRQRELPTIGPPFRLSSVDRHPFFCGHGGITPRAIARLHKRGVGGMLTIIKASVVGSALMLLASCTGYLTNYQTPCVEGHVCECVRYTTINRSWVDCRDYGRVKSKAY